jgi:hypothetical protein
MLVCVRGGLPCTRARRDELIYIFFLEGKKSKRKKVEGGGMLISKTAESSSLILVPCWFGFEFGV